MANGLWRLRVRTGEGAVCAAMCLGAVLAAVGVSAVTGRLAAPERWEYSQIAEGILQGKGAVYEYLDTPYYFYGSPVYAVLLAAVLWVSQHREAMMLIVQACVFGLTCLMVYHIASLLFGRWTATLAACLAALHPGGLMYVGKLHAQTLDVFLITVAFLLLLRTSGGTRPLRAVGTGVVAGLAVLSRGPIAPFFVLWTAWFCWRQRRRLRRALGIVVAMTIGAGLIMAPVFIRGYRLYGGLVPLRTDTGANFWCGNHPGASGTSYTASSPPIPVIATIPQDLRARLKGVRDIDQHRILMAAGWGFIRRHPVEALGLFMKKLSYFWWRSPHTGLLYPRGWTRVYLIYYAVILGLALLGVVAAMGFAGGPARSGTCLFGLLVGSFSIAQALFYIDGRHRWQVEPLLLVYAAAGFLWAARAWGGALSCGWAWLAAKRTRRNAAC